METRRTDFAGSWYPASESDCRRLIEAFMSSGRPCPAAKSRFVGGIVPHAGWVYSGKVACNVIGCLRSGGGPPETVVVFGRHLHPGGRNYIMREGRWATPLGDLEVDRELAEGLISLFPFVQETPDRSEPDNTIELQLPFIKHFFPEAMVLPIGVPPARGSLDIGRSVAELADSKGRNILVLGSTDLTHYGPNYGFMPAGDGKEAVEWVKNENDKRVRDLMLRMDAEGVIEESLRSRNACCSGAVAAAIETSRKSGARQGIELSYTTSYDIRADSSFVGYTGVLFF
jgi:AmmeMemoRadiSam system protein B